MLDNAIGQLCAERDTVERRLHFIERAIGALRAVQGGGEVCANGHARTAENTRYRVRNGKRQRVCCVCTRIAARRHDQRKRGQGMSNITDSVAPPDGEWERIRDSIDPEVLVEVDEYVSKLHETIAQLRLDLAEK